MSSPPAFQLYPKDFECDEAVRLMSCEQIGAYIQLLCCHWREGSVPADVGKLALLVRLPGPHFARKVWPAVSPCFVPGPEGRLINPRMDRDRQRLEAHRAERSESGKRGNEARWHKPGQRRAPQQRSLSDAGAIAERRQRETWLTPYIEAWHERWGAESAAPTGEMARSLKQAQTQLKGDVAETVARWRRFLAQAGSSQWARPARFVQGLGEWAASAPQGQARRGVTGNNMAAARQFMERAEVGGNG